MKNKENINNDFVLEELDFSDEDNIEIVNQENLTYKLDNNQEDWIYSFLNFMRKNFSTIKEEINNGITIYIFNKSYIGFGHASK